MPQLIETVQHLRSIGMFTALVYLQEAHADNLWPLGYGIRSHDSSSDRINACSTFLGKHAGLRDSLHAVAVDTMDDGFLHKYGAWPERYFLADVSGRVLWASSPAPHMSQETTSHSLQEVLDFIKSPMVL